MFRLFTASVPAFVLFLSAATAAGAAPLEPLWNAPQSLLNPTARPGILPGGCYLPEYGGMVSNPAACPSGWCGTMPRAAAASSLAWDCPNSLELEPHRPAGRLVDPYTGRIPPMPADSRPLPERSLPRPAIPPPGGVFGSDRIGSPTDHLRHDFEYRERVPLGRSRPVLDRTPQRPLGDFHILPVSDHTSDRFLGVTPFAR